MDIHEQYWDIHGYMFKNMMTHNSPHKEFITVRRLFLFVSDKNFSQSDQDQLSAAFDKILAADRFTDMADEFSRNYARQHASYLLNRWNAGRRGDKLLTDL